MSAKVWVTLLKLSLEFIQLSITFNFLLFLKEDIVDTDRKHKGRRGNKGLQLDSKHKLCSYMTCNVTIQVPSLLQDYLILYKFIYKLAGMKNIRFSSV